MQRLYFLMRLPTRQDGFQNCEKKPLSMIARQMRETSWLKDNLVPLNIEIWLANSHFIDQLHPSFIIYFNKVMVTCKINH